MSGLNLKKFTIPSKMIDSMHDGKVPLSIDLDKAISDSDGDSDD